MCKKSTERDKVELKVKRFQVLWYWCVELICQKCFELPTYDDDEGKVEGSDGKWDDAFISDKHVVKLFANGGQSNYHDWLMTDNSIKTMSTFEATFYKKPTEVPR